MRDKPQFTRCFMNRFIKLKADSGLGFFRVLSAAQHIVIYDVTEATRRHLVTPKNSDSLSSSPLKLADFKQLAISNYAWVAEIHGHRPGNTIYMPHHFAHDVFTTNVDVLYMGLQGNWLTSLPESSTLLIRASDQENGHMRFQITQQSISALFLGDNIDN